MKKEIDFLVYRLPDEDGEVKAVVKNETLWTTQKGMAELFGVDKSTISRHLKNIFSEGELDEKVVVAKIATTTPHGAIVGKTQTTDIFAECSIDYDKDSDITQAFYSMVQNRFHYAITGQTAAEIIYNNADSSKDNMGLTTWKNSPDGRILKSDVSIAKNYLDEQQIRRLERAVSGYFDYIEDLIERENTFTMEEFANSINEFLTFRKYKILPDRGSVSAAQAKRKAEIEYDKFNKTQRINSDFDKLIAATKEKK